MPKKRITDKMRLDWVLVNLQTFTVDEILTIDREFINYAIRAESRKKGK